MNIPDIIGLILLSIMVCFGAVLVYFWVLATAQRSESRLRLAMWRIQQEARQERDHLHADDERAIYDANWKQYLNGEGPYDSSAK